MQHKILYFIRKSNEPIYSFKIEKHKPIRKGYISDKYEDHLINLLYTTRDDTYAPIQDILHFKKLLDALIEGEPIEASITHILNEKFYFCNNQHYATFVYPGMKHIHHSQIKRITDPNIDTIIIEIVKWLVNNPHEKDYIRKILKTYEDVDSLYTYLDKNTNLHCSYNSGSDCTLCQENVYPSLQCSAYCSVNRRCYRYSKLNRRYCSQHYNTKKELHRGLTERYNLNNGFIVADHQEMFTTMSALLKLMENCTIDTSIFVYTDLRGYTYTPNEMSADDFFESNKDLIADLSKTKFIHIRLGNQFQVFGTDLYISQWKNVPSRFSVITIENKQQVINSKLNVWSINRRVKLGRGEFGEIYPINDYCVAKVQSEVTVCKDEIKTLTTLNKSGISPYIFQSLHYPGECVIIMEKLKPIEVYTNAIHKEVKNLELKLLTEYGIKHNDLHKGNVMQTQEGEVRLIDFGLIEKNNNKKQKINE